MWLWPRPFQEWFAIVGLELITVNQYAKFYVSNFTRYEDMNSNAKCKNRVGWVGKSLGLLQVINDVTIP